MNSPTALPSSPMHTSRLLKSSDKALLYQHQHPEQPPSNRTEGAYPTACSNSCSRSFTHIKPYSCTSKSTSHLTNPCKRTEGASTNPTTTRSTTYCTSACSTSAILQMFCQDQCTISTYPSSSSHVSAKPTSIKFVHLSPVITPIHTTLNLVLPLITSPKPPSLTCILTKLPLLPLNQSPHLENRHISKLSLKALMQKDGTKAMPMNLDDYSNMESETRTDPQTKESKAPAPFSPFARKTFQQTAKLPMPTSSATSAYRKKKPTVYA